MVLAVQAMFLASAFAHKTNVKHNHDVKDAPEIDGNEVALALLAVVCIWLVFRALNRRTADPQSVN